MPSRRLKLVVAYRGTRYHGWQQQDANQYYKGELIAPGAGIPTVQEVLARAIQSVVGHPVTLVGSSRTDAGVHAKGQLAHFDTEQAHIPPDGLRQAVNARLLDDILVRKIEEAPDTFDAISSTTSKRYQYFIWNAEDRPPFFSDLCWYLWKPMDIEPMRQAAAALVGEHDFASFCRPGHLRENTIRRVFDCQVSRRGNMIVVGIEGGGFLWNMVRIIVGTLAEVGIGRFPPAVVQDMLAAKDRRAAGLTAPAQGLYLQWVKTREEGAPPEQKRTAGAVQSAVRPKWFVRRMRPSDRPLITALAHALPEWFDPRGRRNIGIDIQFQRGLVASDGPTLLGFLSYSVSQTVARLEWIGVRPELHRQGIGRALVQRLELELRRVGVSEIVVDTPGDSVECEPYAKTRAFYRAMGFAEYQRVMQNNPSCPERLTMRKIMQDK